MRRQLKRLLIAVLTLCLLIVPLYPVSAAASQEEIMPLLNNTANASVVMSINDSGKMTITYKYVGFSGITTHAVITSYIEKKTLGLFWTRVDNGQPDKQWVDTVEGYSATGTRTCQLAENGTFRVTAIYKVYGSGGAADEIECQATDTY